MATTKDDHFHRMYVVEWLHRTTGDWTAIDGSTGIRTAQEMQRKWRGESPKEQFRIRKYVREEM